MNHSRDIETLVTSLFASIPRETRQEIVRLVVEELGISKSEVARMMSVTPSAVTRFVKGEAAPSPESLARLFLSLEPDERGRIIKVIVDYVTSLLRVLRLLMDSGLVEHDRYELEISVEELLDTAMLLLEKSAGGYRGAHSSPGRLGERSSSKPPAASDIASRLRSRL